MKSLSAKTFQCGVTVQGLTTLSGTVYLTALTNTATWDYVVVGTTAQGQLYTRTYAQLMSDITSGIGLSGYVPTSRTLTINGVSYDLTANRSWTITTPYVSKLQHTVKAGVAINKGQAVYVTSADGTNMIVGLASNASEATSSKTMGLLDATVSTNGFANVVTEGLLDGLDTSTAGAAGDPVWLGTGGNLIYGLANKPYAPAHLVFIGIVTRKNSNNGEIFVKVQNGFELNEIHDVDLKTNLPVNGELLGFNGTLWVNKTIAGWLGYTPANASGTTNYISKFTGSTTLGNSQIFDNGTNVGIGTVTPDSRLHIEGNTTGSGSGADAIVHIKQNGGWNGNEPWALYVEGYSYLNGFRVNAYDAQRGLYSDAGELGFAVGGNSPISFTQNTSDYRMYIAPGGNIGIGTTSPSYKLQVNADGAGLYVLAANTAPYTQTIASFVYGGNGNSINIENQGGKASIQARAGASVMDLHLNPVGGNVGIGTAAPAYKLQVASGDIAIDYDRYLRGGYSGGWNLVNLYNGATGDIEITMNNVNWYLRHNANATFAGKVGIGTTNPAFKLEIGAVGSGYVSAKLTQTYEKVRYNNFDLLGYDDGHLWMIGNNNPSIVLASSWDWDNQVEFDYVPNTVGTAAGVLSIGQTNKNNANYTHGITRFFTNGLERLRIDSSGNVGIGTSSPQSKLHIETSSSNPFRMVRGTTNFGFEIGGGAIGLYDYEDSIYRWYVDSVGNVGIGTTSPGAKLDVNGAQIIQLAAGFGTDGDQAALFLSNTANYGLSGNFSGYSRNLIKSDGGSVLTVGRWNTSLIGELSIESGSSGLIKFLAGGSERMRITSGGNVGIGTTSPDTKLHVSGSGYIIKAQAGGSDSAYLQAINGSYDYIAGIATSLGLGWMGMNSNHPLAIITNGNERIRIAAGGNVGIGTTSPSTLLDVNGVITATGGNSTQWNTAYSWGNHSSAGYVPQARTLTINGTTYDLSANRSWTIATTTPGGSNTQFQYNSSGTLAGASALTYDSGTNRVGINQASPGYDLDVNGQVRVQDKLRVGNVNSGNGVVHMSSTATINPSATTVVWAQTVSVGMCAFIEYYILNNNSLTDQRAGTIMVTWNQSGTPTITHTETTTPDIGSTTTVNFTSSLVGSDARINAVNSSANPYTMVMSYKYF